MVHDLVELRRDQVIDLRDAGIDHRLRVGGDRHRALEHLGDKVLDELLATLFGGRVAAEPTLVDDLVEEADLRRCVEGALRLALRLRLRHRCLP